MLEPSGWWRESIAVIDFSAPVEQEKAGGPCERMTRIGETA
jgi:hypothetical protein